jgi:hypothetical protein
VTIGFDAVSLSLSIDQAWYDNVPGGGAVLNFAGSGLLCSTSSTFFDPSLDWLPLSKQGGAWKVGNVNSRVRRCLPVSLHRPSIVQHCDRGWSVIEGMNLWMA